VQDSNKKIISLLEACALAKKHKASGKTIVTTNGCFDILHVGHIRLFQYAKSLGDILIVGINTDDSVRDNKDLNRPIISERERSEIIASIYTVDIVFLFGDKTPISWIKKIKPHIHVKGGDRTLNQIIEKNAVEANGGRVELFNYQNGNSTSSIIERILKTYKD